MKVLVIVPAYNEEKNILNTIKDLEKYKNYFDYIIINDCSTDKTEDILLSKKINHISLKINLGLSGAVQTGYKFAYENGYDAAIQFDGDGQHQAKYIKDLSEHLEEADIVIGSRFVTTKKNSSMRMIGSRLLSLLIKIKTGVYISDPTSGMRIINRKCLYDFAYNINFRPEPDTLVTEIRKGFVVKEIQVKMNERNEGTSLYSSPLNAISYMVRMIISIIFVS